MEVDIGATSRSISMVITPQLVMEGAGVRLQRSFPSGASPYRLPSAAVDYLDPFLLLDHFGSDNPDDYMPGFPMHPHRGIETVTYMLAGEVNHKDSLGNSGSIGPGDVQWMTSGRGILHEEMPAPRDGKMAGFQLWVNLPAKLKMSDPRYQEILADSIPVVEMEGAARVGVIAGSVGGATGPVTEIAAEPIYMDVSIQERGTFRHPTERGHTAFAYLFEGEGEFGMGDDGRRESVQSPKLVVFSDGDEIEVRTQEIGVRFLLVTGKPLGERVARYGPFVMNTQEEIEQALSDLRNGTFIMP